MGLIRSGGSRWVKVLAYPYVRAARDLRTSVQHMRESRQELRSRRERRLAEAREVTRLLAGLAPDDKFARAAAAWGWDEAALAQQQVAAARTRLAALGASGVAFAGLLVLMAFTGGWVALPLAGAALVVLLSGLLQALRFAWWEYQLETRRLVPFRGFLSRRDLPRRLLRLGAVRRVG